MENDRGPLYFCLGCAVGTVAATLLLTSKSGRKGVRYLREKTDEGTRNLSRRVDDLTGAVADAADRGIKAVRQQADGLAAAVEAGKRAYEAVQETGS